MHAYSIHLLKFLPGMAQAVETSHIKYFWNQTCHFLVVQNLSSKIMMSSKGFVLKLYIEEIRLKENSNTSTFQFL